MSGHNNSYYAPNNGYNNQYQSTYPSSGFAQPQPYYGDNSNQSYGYQNQQANSYYQPQTGPGDADPYYNNTQQPGQMNPDGTQDRGLLGAMAGGAAGAYAGHKTRGHGVLGALGGAILGSLTEDYAKKGKKNKKNKGGAASSGSGIFSQVSSSMKK